MARAETYLLRVWITIQIGAAYSVKERAARARLFRGALKMAIAVGRRPHLIFSDKEIARTV
jgi:hypothetical protein